jgi:hypothetical protein
MPQFDAALSRRGMNASVVAKIFAQGSGFGIVEPRQRQDVKLLAHGENIVARRGLLQGDQRLEHMHMGLCRLKASGRGRPSQQPP